MLSASFGMLHALAVVALVLITIPLWIKAVAIVAVLITGIKVIAQYSLLKTGNSIVKINAPGTGDKCKIKTRDGRTHRARLKSADWLFGYFVLLVFGTDKKTFKSIIAKDAVHSEKFYALRLYLRAFNTPKSTKAGFTHL